MIKNFDKTMDVEELKSYGRENNVCPYYMSRDLKDHADIILMPYTYLL